jgi:hypothetical protein
MRGISFQANQEDLEGMETSIQRIHHTRKEEHRSSHATKGESSELSDVIGKLF